MQVNQPQEPFVTIAAELEAKCGEPSNMEFEAFQSLVGILGNDDIAIKAVNGLYCATVLCHGLAKRAGWWHDLQTGEPKDRNDGEMIALMHSELSEALEGLRKDRQDDHLPHRRSVEVELADTLVRIFDYAGARGLDLAGALVEKLAYNAKRADHKPENRAKADGKKF
ncbi:hypothetical protein [Pseudomonas phage Persinger]|uniref:MazG-like nucleotide pyrophosphohydrolase n=1 Tax=Pseudomonas phage Persinger TaxID=2749430 RepID=A0A7D7ILV5_9CAUD|nr:pyrophosphatase [Pseudomonas phage Persinger]QMP19220.1 hypothetical protein [Pseudomonas phage Persinger]